MVAAPTVEHEFVDETDALDLVDLRVDRLRLPSPSLAPMRFQPLW
jgi:hypothetical protein